MSGIVATVAMAAAILITEFGSGSVGTLFSLVLGFTISTTTLSYLFIFPTFLILRYKYPNVHRPYKVPGGMVGAWIVTVLPLAYALIASYFILIPTDSSVSSYSVSRLTYELTQFLPLAFIVLLTAVFFIWGQSEKRNRDVVVELSPGEDMVEGLGGVTGD
jgi:amino acid transporter